MYLNQLVWPHLAVVRFSYWADEVYRQVGFCEWLSHRAHSGRSAGNLNAHTLNPEPAQLCRVECDGTVLFTRLVQGAGAELSKTSKAIARIFAVAASVALIATSVSAIQTVTPAEALTGSDFNAGNIISDSLFYDGGAMSEAEIQSFLNSKIGSCTNGQCLNVLTAAVASRPAVYSNSTGNLVCSAFEGGTLSAASIIYRAQVACSISAKVLLVTLQKEQSLVTSRAPSASTLARAMGMACPDTAPCAEYALGFGNQLYEGAKQLHFYKAGRFAKQPGVQAIGYHPNTACGSAVINVQNYATAALYNYTPYQPNAAALANLGAVGDSCSSYGNRNFWAYYNSWFGPTDGSPASSPDFGTNVVVRDSLGDLWMFPGNGKGGWGSTTKIGNGWGSFLHILGVGDFNGDLHRDIIGVDANGVMRLYPMNGSLGWLTVSEISSGWETKTAIFSVGDFSGDGFQDLMSRDAAGDLWLHSGNGQGGLRAPIKIGNGWQGMTALFGAGDFNGDGKQDVIGRSAAGTLTLYPGNGSGGWGYPVAIGWGWNGMNSLSNPGDFNGDGTQDVLGRVASGDMWLYPGNGRGGWGTPVQVGSSWSGLTAIVGPGSPIGKPFVEQPGAGDLNADGARDVLVTDAAGSVYLYPGNGSGGWRTAKKIADGWAGRTISFGAADFDSNGIANVITRDTSGALLLHASDGIGGLGAPASLGTGWDAMNAIFAAGDINGDRKSDIIARDESGILWLYPGDGAGGLVERQQVGNGWGSFTALFSAGDFDGDGKSDLIARGAGGELWLYSGTGNGTWTGPRQIGNGWGGFTALFSPGDFTGDGNNDVLARSASGGLWLYSGDGRGGWLGGQQIGWGWGGLSWIG